MQLKAELTRERTLKSRERFLRKKVQVDYMNKTKMDKII